MVQRGSCVIYPIALVRQRIQELERWEAIYGDRCYIYVYSWLIKDPDGWVLVDVPGEAETMSRESVKGIRWEQVKTLGNALEELGTSIGDIKTVIVTHMHIDHASGLEQFRGSKIIVQQREMDWLRSSDKFAGFFKKGGLAKLAYTIVNGEYRVTPEIRVVPVPGHTPGGQAVLVETKVAKVAIAGFCSLLDNFYPRRMVTLETETPPGQSLDSEEARQSIRTLKEMADLIIPLHDSFFAKIKHIPT